MFASFQQKPAVVGVSVVGVSARESLTAAVGAREPLAARGPMVSEVDAREPLAACFHRVAGVEAPLAPPNKACLIVVRPPSETKK